MSLEHELRQLFGRIEDAPWPGEPEAFDQFLRRKARRGRVMAAAVVAGVLVVVAVAGLLPALKMPTQPLTLGLSLVHRRLNPRPGSRRPTCLPGSS